MSLRTGIETAARPHAVAAWLLAAALLAGCAGAPQQAEPAPAEPAAPAAEPDASAPGAAALREEQAAEAPGAAPRPGAARGRAPRAEQVAAAGEAFPAETAPEGKRAPAPSAGLPAPQTEQQPEGFRGQRARAAEEDELARVARVVEAERRDGARPAAPAEPSAGSGEAAEPGLRRTREPYLFDPDPSPAAGGPLVLGVDWLAAPTSPPPAAARPHAPVLVCRLQGERLDPLEAEELQALRRGFGRGAAVLEPDRGLGAPAGSVTLAELLAHARSAGAGALVLVRLEGEGQGRSARLLLYAVEDGTLLAQRAGLLPGLELLGAEIAQLVR
ncbi:MAG: hypothetical protein KatS3mg102_2306 [Planctomycetota bacterium]|nr:MAG: hypothetical protein KatS3mg102_2306 [Planctomycetota bacterium]